MRCQARLIGPAEEKRFDAFICNHPKGHFLQSYGWGEVKAATGWQPLRLVLEKEGRIIAAASLLKRTLPHTGKAILYAPRGPVVDFHDPDLFDAVLSAINQVAAEHGSFLLKIDPDIPESDVFVKQLLQERGFRLATGGAGFDGVQPRHVFRLDLTPSPEELLAAMHSKTRYNIRLAAKKGVTIKSDCTLADLPVFYDLLRETTIRDRFLVRSYDYFATMWREMVERGYAKLFLAYYQGQAIAGTLAFIMGDKAWYLYGASSNRYRNVMPNYLIQWTMICWAREQGCTLYDFRGVPGNLDEDNPLYGLYRFKQGFNGVFTEFVGEYDLVYNPVYYWLWHTALPLYSRGFRRLLFWKKKATSEK